MGISGGGGGRGHCFSYLTAWLLAIPWAGRPVDFPKTSRRFLEPEWFLGFLVFLAGFHRFFDVGEWFLRFLDGFCKVLLWFGHTWLTERYAHNGLSTLDSPNVSLRGTTRRQLLSRGRGRVQHTNIFQS